MSLINDALRKARQAASEHEANQPEGAFQPARAYPSRRSGRGRGLLAVALIAVAAAAVGASAAWWLLGDRQTVATAPEVNDARPSGDLRPAATATKPASPIDDRSEPAFRSPAADAANPPMVLGRTALVAPTETAPEQTPAETRAPTPAATSPAAGPGQGRIYVLEAKLGYTSLSLGYIVARRDNPFAEINGTEVWVGSEIEGFVVETIEANRVVLRDDNGPLELRVP